MSNTVSIQNISIAAARRMTAAAEAKAAALGVPSVIAICDTGGILKAFSRMDGAPLMAVKVAQDKAFTAAGFGLATSDWYGFIKDDPSLLAGVAPGVDRLIIFGGGFPIIVDGAVVGGIGVSGGLPSQDMEAAQAGLAALVS